VGGAAVEFGVIGTRDAQGCGHADMSFILHARDLIAFDIESMIEAHRLEGGSVDPS
jgi:dihydroxy-acid dehydratase